MATTGSTPPGVPPNIALLLGPELVGVCVNWLLWGVLTVQLYYYFLFFNDGWRVKTLVIGLFLLDSLQSIFSLRMTFMQMASGWGNLEPLFSPGLSFEMIPVLSGIISCLVQMFFAHRIYTLSGNRLKQSMSEKVLVNAIVAFICCTALAQASAAIAATAKYVSFNNTAFINRLNPEVSVWLGGSSVCDITITITMVFLLRKAKQRSTHSFTHRLINKLMQKTVETGLVTAVTATAELILFLTSKHTNVHIALVFMLAKLYSNTLLASLNSRLDTRSVGPESHSTSTVQWKTQSSRRNPRTFNAETSSDDSGFIQVQTVKHIHHDAYGSESLPDNKLSQARDSPLSGYHSGSGSMA